MRGYKGLPPSSGARRRIFGSLLTVSSFSFLVKATGAAKTVVVARYFGLTDSLDAFLIAFVALSFLAEAISGATNAALVPVLVETRTRGGLAAARRVFITTTLITASQLVLLALAIWAFAHPLLGLLGSGFSSQKLAMAQSSLVGLLPVLVFSGLSATWRGVLNASGRFALAAAVPACVPVVTIALVLAAGASSTGATLVEGAVMGAVIELFALGIGLRSRGYRWGEMRPAWDAATRQVMRQYAPMLAGSVVLGASMPVAHAMAAMLEPGSVSALSYGSKLLSVVVALGPAAMATVALPLFSEMAVRRELEGIRQAVSHYRRWILAATIPLTLLLVLSSEPLARVLYQRGAFTPVDTALVAPVQAFFLMQLPFAMLTALVFRVISALRANETLMRAALVHLVTLVATSVVLVRVMGVTGVALGSTIAAMAHYAFLHYTLPRLMERAAAAGSTLALPYSEPPGSQGLTQEAPL